LQHRRIAASRDSQAYLAGQVDFQPAGRVAVAGRRVRHDVDRNQLGSCSSIRLGVTLRGRVAAKFTLPLIERGWRHADLGAELRDAQTTVSSSLDQLPPKRTPIGIRPSRHRHAPCQAENSTKASAYPAGQGCRSDNGNVEREFKHVEFEIDDKNLRFLDRLDEPYSYSINTTTNPKRMRITSQANPSDGCDILYKTDATQLTLGINPHGAEMTDFDDGIILVLKGVR
jgi:hypothetical protein